MARILGQVQETQNLQNKTNHQLTLYARRDSIVNEINTHNTNTQYLPILSEEPTFSKSVFATSNVTQAVENADMIVIAVPSAFLENILLEIKPFVLQDAVFISLVKSLHYDVNEKRMRTTVDDVLTHFPSHRAMAISGPNLYSEMATSQSSFTEATIGYNAHLDSDSLATHSNHSAARLFQNSIHTPLFQTSLSPDRIGVEICGGLKNVISLAIGFSNGVYDVHPNHNTKAAIVRAGMHEMTRFMVQIMKLNQDISKRTVFESSAGMGDLMLTCTAGRGRLLAYEFIKLIESEGVSSDKEINVERWAMLEKETMNGMKLPDWHNAQEVYRALVDYDCVEDFPLLEAVYKIGFMGYEPEYIIEALSKSIQVSDQ